MAAGAADQRRAIDTGLAVEGRADQLSAGGRDAGADPLQRRRVGDLEADVVVARLGSLDQDQLVMARVAGQVADAPDPLGLDETEHVLLEVDRRVEIANAVRHVADAGNHRLVLTSGN